MPAHQHAATLATIRRVASRQRMLVATRQLDLIGMSEQGRRHAVAEGDLRRRRRGVYGLPGAGTEWEDDVMAAALAAGPDAVACLYTAARLWGLNHERAADLPRQPIELTSPRLVRITGLRSYTRPLPANEVTRRSRVPVTTVSRTLLDLCPCLDHGTLGALVDDALRQNVVSLQELARVAGTLVDGRGRTREGAPALRLLIRERLASPGPGANAWEERMDREWDRMGLPAAARQHWITTPHGRYCVDRAIVELKIAVEWNGFEYHGRRSRFDRDSERRGHLIEAGWLVLDFTSRSTPEHIVRTVQAAVAQRRRALGHPLGPEPEAG